MNVLIADPDREWSERLKKYLIQNNVSSTTTSSGKESQLQIYKQTFETVVLDMKMQNHSALEVLKFIKLNHPGIRVLLTCEQPDKLSQLGLNDEALKKMGVRHILSKPYKEDSILRFFNGQNEASAWKELTSSPVKSVHEEVKLEDDEFSRVHVSTFVGNDVTIMDYYIRLAAGKYVKLFHQGEAFQDSELRVLIEEKKLEYLYFKNSDRRLYINFMNDFLETTVIDPVKKKCTLRTYEDVVDKYMSEIYSSGINSDLIDEGMKICSSMFRLVQANKSMSQMMASLEKTDDTAYREQFLSSFFSVVISKNLEWTSKRTTEYTALGSLFSSVGKMKVDPEILKLPIEDLTGPQLVQLQLYPLKGFGILSEFSFIDEPVRQIVYQHQERIDGSGFPGHLRGSQIFPLAKIVGVSAAFAKLIVEDELSPMEALRVFVTDRENIMKFDAQCIRALITGFINKEKTNEK